MLRLVAIVFGLAALTAESAAETGAASHGALHVGIRIASSEASNETYAKFQVSLDAAMRSSSHPRDWALAAVTSPDPQRTIGAPGPRYDGDLFRAQQAAPGDALVQWLVANNADRTTPEGEVRVAGAIEALTRIEPDNAAPWMLALQCAVKRGDTEGSGEALARMAESRRFDDHFADVVHAWIDVYDRHPPPSLSIEESTGYDPGFVAAFAHAAAVALPSYQFLVQACKPATGQALEADRRAHCEKAGRLMLQHGTTLIARRIGFVVVRNADALTDADRAAERDLDWYRFNVASDEPSIVDALSHEDDWRRLDDEIDVIRNELRRNHLPTAAPDGWSYPERAAATAAR
ncbi:MAG TPA: hypothetical protein VFL30_02240 [Rhodanobacteraceae bacterium]|nr:hypothetical protein [Rhodanobacteraceae bacterium]